MKVDCSEKIRRLRSGIGTLAKVDRKCCVMLPDGDRKGMCDDHMKGGESCAFDSCDLREDSWAGGMLSEPRRFRSEECSLLANSRYWGWK